MIVELGHFALVLAFVVAAVQGTLPLAGAHYGVAPLYRLALPAARLQFLLLVLSYAALSAAFLQDDFSVRYIAQHSSAALPTYYKLAAVWGAHEGSLLLWILILGAWTFAVTLFNRGLTEVFLARVLAVMGLVAAGFMLFTLATSNPFERLFPAAAAGRDLNPLLQDPGLTIHPPMLYMGYVGFSVAFAFAVSALLDGRLDGRWARWSRPWVLAAWVFLTIGITLGSWWAYHELGWGGWWFWDPVENASFMPWLVGTALLHSLAVTEKRNAFKGWTVLLAILAFSLSLLGTFLVRSGVLVSVHAFASDPERGVFILLFLVVAVGGSLALYAWRAPRIRSTGVFDFLSRENLLLINNVILLVTMFTILIGTLYPLALDALGLDKISVGAPYFSAVFVPLMLLAALAAGVGPAVQWKRSSPHPLLRRLRAPLAVALVAALVLAAVFGDGVSPGVFIGAAAGSWVLLTTALNLGRRLRRDGPRGGLRSLPLSFYGMSTAHLGLALFIFGVTFSSAYSEEKMVHLQDGQSVELAGYKFVFEGVADREGPNYMSKEGRVGVFRGGEPVAVLHPERRTYRVQSDAMTEAAVDASPLRDLYVAMGEEVEGGRREVRVYYKPLIRWIWLGAMLMALGGVLSASDARYRVARRAVRADSARADGSARAGGAA